MSLPPSTKQPSSTASKFSASMFKKGKPAALEYGFDIPQYQAPNPD
jgi:hypothetical protein